MKRRRYGRELWDRLVEFVEPDDGLPVFETSGYWSAKKLFFLCNYLELFSRGMHGNRHFASGLTYIDLFGGNGVTVVKKDGRRRRYPGSAILAGSLVDKPFARLLFNDSSEENIAAIKARLSRLGRHNGIECWAADANIVVEKVANRIPAGSLSVAFLDPMSLELSFDTVRTLATGRAIDLVVLMADRFDIGRNIEEYYLPGKSPLLDRFLGTNEWRSRYSRLATREGGPIRQLFAEIYIDQLHAIGYRHCKSWPVEGPLGPAYRLVYASKHERGLAFCEIALNEDFEGGLGLWGAM